MKQIIALLLAVAAVAQPPLSSDSRQVPAFRRPDPNIYPGRAPMYIAPHDDVFPVLITNTRPLVVEVTITSNIVRRTIWYLDGSRNTNEAVLSSSTVSCVTNALIPDVVIMRTK